MTSEYALRKELEKAQRPRCDCSDHVDESAIKWVRANAVAEEREACAKLVEEWEVDRAAFAIGGPRAWVMEPRTIATAIRARSSAPETKAAPKKLPTIAELEAILAGEDAKAATVEPSAPADPCPNEAELDQVRKALDSARKDLEIFVLRGSHDRNNVVFTIDRAREILGMDKFGAPATKSPAEAEHPGRLIECWERIKELREMLEWLSKQGDLGIEAKRRVDAILASSGKPGGAESQATPPRRRGER